jgi:choline dehydrogenase-like flavoprotein
MICDFNELDDGSTLTADVCIIGSGAAGITLAREFQSTHHRIVLVESGGHKPEAETQQLYTSEVVGMPHGGVHVGRARILGGTTTLWAGQTLPLDEIDFRYRPWIPNSGWPLVRSVLEPYYRRAEQTLHLPEIAYDAAEWPYRTPPPPVYDRSKLRPLISQFSPKANFALTYRAALEASGNITVLLHGSAVSLRTNASATFMEALELRSLSGKKGEVKARYFIVCCGAIESARLLLASNSVQPNGLGNDNGLVGRFFQDHAGVKTARVRLKNPAYIRELYDPFYWHGVALSPKIALSEQVQEQQQVLNATVGITYDQAVETDSPVEAAKRVARAVWNRRLDLPVPAPAGATAAVRPYGIGGFVRDCGSTLIHPFAVGRAVYHRAILRRPAFRYEGDAYVAVLCECEPIPGSCVSLSDQVDALGMPRVCLNWRLSEMTRRTAVVAVQTLADEFRRLNLGEVDLATLDTERIESAPETCFVDMNHHIGTTRMSDHPDSGVVNRDCRMHSVDNLFIASSSVFPTGGHSNPTFTILAITIRMADHLKQFLQ